jgi:hypothetical protein
VKLPHKEPKVIKLHKKLENTPFQNLIRRDVGYKRYQLRSSCERNVHGKGYHNEVYCFES